VKVSRKETIETVIEGGELVIEDVQIGGHTYELRISGGSGDCFLDFDGEFKISIDVDKQGRPYLTLHRYVARPGHDHGDHDTLVVTKDADEHSHEPGVPWWYSGSVRTDDSYEKFRLPFGAAVITDAGYHNHDIDEFKGARELLTNADDETGEWRDDDTRSYRRTNKVGG